MLEEILAHLHNYFVVPGGAHTGRYTIAEGSLALPFLSAGQYFRICGSVFNDGLYRYGDAVTLTDEVFEGSVWALAVPQAVQTLAQTISTWKEAHPPSAYVSESFGGYSATRAAGSDGKPAGWQEVFRSELNAWRKL